MENIPIQYPGTFSPATYRVTITGVLTGYWVDWFNGMVINVELPGGDKDDTTMTVCVPDQAALRGILNKLWDLNRTLISVQIIHS